MTIDSHFHALSMARKGITSLPEDLIGIDVGTDPGDYAERLKALPSSPAIFMSAGSGPWRLADDDYAGPEAEIERMMADIRAYGADAIGECGFDNHWKYGDRQGAMDLFMAQAGLAAAMSVPLIIHAREADEEIRQALSSSAFGCRAIMHCFSSGPDIARAALDKGLYISFAGNVTYKGNEIIRESARIVPADRILVETDSPYLAPIPMRGRPSSPEFTEYTLTFLAELRREDRERLKERIRENLISVLGREESVTKGARAGKE